MFLSLIYQNKTKHMNQNIIIRETNHSAGQPVAYTGNEFVLFADLLELGNHITSIKVNKFGICNRSSEKVLVAFSQQEVRLDALQYNRVRMLAEKYNACNAAYSFTDSFEEA